MRLGPFLIITLLCAVACTKGNMHTVFADNSDNVDVRVMRIIAFIRDPQAIKQIADSLGLAPYQTPPPMAVGPPQVEDFAFGNADFADSDFPPQDS